MASLISQKVPMMVYLVLHANQSCVKVWFRVFLFLVDIPPRIECRLDCERTISSQGFMTHVRIVSVLARCTKMRRCTCRACSECSVLDLHCVVHAFSPANAEELIVQSREMWARSTLSIDEVECVHTGFENVWLVSKFISFLLPFYYY